ncbi:hypothetical protein [Streptomyces hokutonensis]|uniref:hypothetical protein n=1 Tax=Streptomyces hokutonensis TaxID=1306990 RepID=UPI0036AC361B
MNATAEPASGREALAAQLGLLQAELRERGTTQKGAVEEANRRRRRAADRPGDVPWPRKDGGVDLSLQAVNDWFPKQKGSKEPSVPQDFEDLWSVVAVMLDWTGQLTDSRAAARLRGDWKELHAEARRGNGLDEGVRAYLEAARKAAEQHPYPGIPGRTAPPSLTEVYVRQRTSPADRHGHHASRGDALIAGRGGDLAPAPELAEALFRKTDRMCVLIAGSGAGKSTLLRTWLRDAAGAWLDATAKTPAAVPVWVSARALAGEVTSIPEALAAATRSLSRYGRQPALDTARFLQRPCTGAHWQLLVDDLDELPNAAERRAVLEKLAHAVAEDPPLYRCVVATRPLTDNELDVLDHPLGHPAPHYELQPFTPGDLTTYTEKYFATRWPHEEAVRRARRFTGALHDASLADLARTPLMAFMLCQLYLARPDRPLPAGRTAVYEAFTDLVYESNRGKRVADSHEEAIRHLVEGLQSPQARQEADHAARQVHERLPELIDYLAHQWLTGHQTPAASALAEHPAVHRPGKVLQELWDAFLEDLLRHTGLLVHHADGLSFAHQTFLEYHAARHATRDQQARRQTLQQLFDTGEPASGWQSHEPSYLGFLLDRLLSPPDDQISEQTKTCLNNIGTAGGGPAWVFFVQQVHLRTNLPAETTAQQLTRLVHNRAFETSARVYAADALARVEGHREPGARLLEGFAHDPTVRAFYRLLAADALARVEGYREDGVRLLEGFVEDPALDTSDRVQAAQVLARVEGYREDGARLLEGFAHDPALDTSDRVLAAQLLTWVDGCKDQGVALLTDFAHDHTLDISDRVQAAQVLARVEGDREDGARLLEGFAHDPALDTSDRVLAAQTLARVDGRKDQGVALLTDFAHDHTLGASGRLLAAEALAEVDGYREDGARLLEGLANDPAHDTLNRIQAAQALTWVGLRRKEQGVALLTDFANDPALDISDRVDAALALAVVYLRKEQGVALLTGFANDPALDPRHRVRAALALTEVDGYREDGARLLETFANDPAHDPRHRIEVAQALTLVGYREDGARLLETFANDPAHDTLNRIRAAQALAQVVGYREDGARLLETFANDPAHDPRHRVKAARELGQVDGRKEQAAALLTDFARDSALDASYRGMAALALAQVDGYREDGARLLETFANDPAHDTYNRVVAAGVLAQVDGYREDGARLLQTLAADSTLSASLRAQAAEVLAELPRTE